MGTHPIFESDFDCLTEKKMSSSDSSDSSDDEMRKRLMETVVTAKTIAKEVKNEKSREKSSLIKVGPYGDIELSRQQIDLLIKMIEQFTDNTIEFREPKKKTNARLEES